MADNLGDCICTICNKLNKIDKNVCSLSVEVSQISTVEVNDKIDILISSVWVLQKKIDALQESINKL